MLILCYHQVGPAATEGRRLNIEPDSLRRQIAWLKRRGYRFVQAGDLAEKWPEKGVCLTFDDAYASTLQHGVEAMKAEGVAGSIYAVASLVGKTSEWDEGHEAKLADWPDLLAAQAAGFEIGNHSLSHPNFIGLSRAEQAEQIGQAQQILAERGIEPRSFCLPYGGLNAETSAAIEQAGHRVGLALGGRQAAPSDDRRLLPRVVIAYGDRIPGLIYRAFIRPKLP